MAFPLKTVQSVTSVMLAILAVACARAPEPDASQLERPKAPRAWSLGIIFGSHPLALKEAKGCPNPRFTRDDVPSPVSMFVADPFLVRYGNRWLLFFELFNSKSQKGEIGLAESDDLCSWVFKDVVLSESFHLSYPFVFRSQGTYYMIPESRQSGAIRLYRALRFPDRWTFDAMLIEGQYTDASPVYFNKTWWLFANQAPYTLKLFFADSLRGPWVEHPQSPMYIDDDSRARPGGRPVVVNNRLIRFVQDNRDGYGRRVRAMSVDILSRTRFAERIVTPDPLLGPHDQGWASWGIHHISPVMLGPGAWVAAIDGNRAEPR